MATISIANLPALVGASAVGDLLPMVDVSDTSQSPLGTTKRITFTALLSTIPVSVTVQGTLTSTGNATVNGSSLTLAPTTGTPTLTLRAPAGTVQPNLTLQSQVGTANRWVLLLGDFTNETGTNNAGSAFRLRAYGDAGALIDDVLFITRAAGGALTLNRPLILNALSTTAISAGAVDSAGAGFRYLRIPNT